MNSEASGTTSYTRERTWQINFDQIPKHHDRQDGAITVSCETSPTHYVFRIADDGPGIAPDFHEKIFMMFETLKPRDKVEGSGMGLAIVKKLLGACGGNIQVTSTIDEGTTFEFTWPVDSRV
jgi:signal transduction histidine kinase